MTDDKHQDILLIEALDISRCIVQYLSQLDSFDKEVRQYTVNNIFSGKNTFMIKRNFYRHIQITRKLMDDSYIRLVERFNDYVDSISLKNALDLDSNKEKLVVNERVILFQKKKNSYNHREVLDFLLKTELMLNDIFIKKS